MPPDTPPPSISTLARARLDALAKPIGSLGRLEHLAARLAETQGRLQPETRPRRLILFAGDHGVLAENISPWPAEITAAMIRLIVEGKACSSALARSTGADIVVVDVGSKTNESFNHSFHRDWRVARGTRNLAREPAMSVDEFSAAWSAGARAAAEAAHDGVKVIALGEMGIGNTTPASCLTALLTGRAAADVVGPGAGVVEKGLQRKVAVVEEAVRRARAAMATDPNGAMAAVAGFEIVALAGCIAECARRGLTVVLDGFIVTAAALVARAIKPGGLATAIAAHCGAEPGHRIALDHLGLTPYLEWDLRLGEGTGALLLLPLLDAAAALLTDVATLAEVAGP